MISAAAPLEPVPRKGSSGVVPQGSAHPQHGQKHRERIPNSKFGDELVAPMVTLFTNLLRLDRRLSALFSAARPPPPGAVPGALLGGRARPPAGLVT